MFEATEGPIGRRTCLLPDRVCDGSECLVGELVGRVHAHVRDYLATTSLAQLARRFTLVRLD